jgi:hypothetical protein
MDKKTLVVRNVLGDPILQLSACTVPTTNGSDPLAVVNVDYLDTHSAVSTRTNFTASIETPTFSTVSTTGCWYKIGDIVTVFLETGHSASSIDNTGSTTTITITCPNTLPPPDFSSYQKGNAGFTKYFYESAPGVFSTFQVCMVPTYSNGPNCFYLNTFFTVNDTTREFVSVYPSIVEGGGTGTAGILSFSYLTAAV